MGILIFNGNKVTQTKTGSEYDGEKIPGDLNGWNVYKTDSNQILESTYGDLQKRSMTLCHTYSPAIAAIDKLTDYSIGPGLVWRSQPDWEGIGKSKEWAKDWGKEAQKIVHWYFQDFNFYEKQQVMMRGGFSLGDSVLKFLYKDGNLDDLVEFGGDEIDWQASSGDYYLGVKYDNYKRRQGLKLISGDEEPFTLSNDNQNIVQLYFKRYPRQLRGYPLLYSVINLCKQDDRHWDATVQRAVMEAVIMASSETTTTDINQQLDNVEKLSEENKLGSAISSLTRTLFGTRKAQPGTVVGLRPGEKWTFNDIKTPGNNFDPFKLWIINFVAMAADIPPEVLLSKYSTSYTAHRGALNDFEKSYMMKRRTFERIVMYPVIREIIKDAIKQGYLKAPGFFDFPRAQRAYLQGMTLGPVPGVINPLQEVNADIKAVDAAFDLRSNKMSKWGNEWDNAFPEWAEEQEQYMRLSPEARAARIAEQEETGNSQKSSNRVDAESLRKNFDAYGLGVRSGAITPQIDDENHFREIADLPHMSDAASKAWDKTGGVRTPITLAKPGEPAEKNESNEDEAEQENQNNQQGGNE